VVEVPAEVAYGIAQFIDPSDELQAMHNKEFICVNSGKECHSRRVFVSRHDSSYFLTTVWPGRLTDTIIR
ncbi:MAG: hypothetical protein GTN93_10495, partial [Anaerolineae bacterium]|nr:hypothetical protein [Anaerolineae bacterium]